MTDIVPATALSTEVKDKTHVIVTYSKTKYFITQVQFNKFMEFSGRAGVKGLEINGQYVSFNNVAEVPEIEAYYDAHPSERPIPKQKNYLEEIEKTFGIESIDGKPYVPLTQRMGDEHLEEFITGMQQQIDFAKKNNEPYAGKVRLLGSLQETLRKRQAKK